MWNLAIDDYKRSMTVFCNSVWNTIWNDIHLTLFDFNGLVVNQEVHLTFNNQQRFIEIVCFIRV